MLPSRSVHRSQIGALEASTDSRNQEVPIRDGIGRSDVLGKFAMLEGDAFRRHRDFGFGSTCANGGWLPRPTFGSGRFVWFLEWCRAGTLASGANHL